MSERIAVLIPSRDRPAKLAQAIKSVRDTSLLADVLVYVDDDQREKYRAVEESELGRMDGRVTMHYGSQVGPVGSANALVDANPGYSVYGLITDDTRMVTNGWDRWVLEAVKQFPNRIVVISPRHNLGEHVDMPFVTREWIDVTGWFAYPRFFHYCWPILTGIMGEMTAIVHAPDSGFSLHHEGMPHTNAWVRKEDGQKFFEFVALRMPVYVEKLRGAMSHGT
jgi:hypothetical protein